MKICLLSSGHRPDDDRIFYKEARSLRKRYDDVTIISPHANNIPDEKYGVTFLSIPTYPLNLTGRLKTIKELFEVAMDINADIYHCHEPESLVVALKLKKQLGCKVIFDSHEMYAATLAQKFHPNLHKIIMHIYRLYERSKIKKCDYAIGATWSITKYLAEALGNEKTETLLNCTLPDIFGEVPEEKPGENIIICHDGHLTFSRGLKTMVKAIDIVRKKHPVKFKIIGDVYSKERAWLESYMLNNNMNGIVERTGWLDYLQVGRAMSECHIGLLAFENLPNHVIAAPNKIFNYMYFGMPFVAPDFCTDIEKLIGEEYCGVTADISSEQSYAEAIIQLIESGEKFTEMGVNGKKAADRKYSWPAMEKELLNSYERLT